MNTKIWTVKPGEGVEQLQEAAQCLANGELVAFPTETVYGLGANALDESAVQKIFTAKGRPSDNPLIVHVSSKEMVSELVESVPAVALQLMDAFWPGALSIIFTKKDGVLSDTVTACLPSVAVRMPSNEVARMLIAEAKVPVAAPSANTSGRPSPTTAEHVREDMWGKIAGIVDGGETGIGLESTVIDCTCEPPMILRTGSVTKEQIEQVIGPVTVDPGMVSKEAAPKSPGMKYTHYAPKAQFILVNGSAAFLQQQIDAARTAGKKVGVFTVEERRDFYQADVILASGSESDLATIAESMYGTLRAFDHTDVDVIFGETFSEEGIGVALMNRLKKAAGHVVISEGR